jgi:quercetin dioxygenase-like cupin family protein
MDLAIDPLSINLNICKEWAMKLFRKAMIGVVGALYVTVMSTPAVFAQEQDAVAHHLAKPRARVAFARALPKLDGNQLNATVVEVNYGPGESSQPHSHPCAVVGYVVEGAIRTQVKGEPEVLLKAGESFYEPPNGVHLVSANASLNEPASFLAFFVCDHDKPLSTDVKTAARPGGN